jgi:hypothetical protein
VYENNKGLFEQADQPDGETESERKEHLAEIEKAKKWNWYGYFYCLAKGDITKMEEVLKLNFLFTLTHKGFEIENKKISEYYDFRRFNVNG